MKKILSVYLFLGLFLMNCSGTTQQFISPEYENVRSQETVSLLVIQKEDFSDKFPNHRFGELRINEQPLFKDQLLDIFQKATGANTESEFKANDIDQTKLNLDLREFTQGGTNLKIIAPETGTVIETEYESPRFVVILDGFRFDSYEELVGGDSYAGHEPEVIPRLTFETNYLIWDNSYGEAIAWGSIDADKVIVLSKIQEMYESILFESLQDMARKSPFPQSKI
jgi:hypothetical protein